MPSSSLRSFRFAGESVEEERRRSGRRSSRSLAHHRLPDRWHTYDGMLVGPVDFDLPDAAARLVRLFDP